MTLARFVPFCLSAGLLPFVLLWAGKQASTQQVSLPVVALRGKLPLSKALAELRRQTGITVRDDRNEADQEVSVDLERASFWQAVDALALSAKAKVVQSNRDGAVSLQRWSRTDRRAPVSYDGPFRIRVMRVTASRDLDSERASCTVGLEVTWTPNLLPLFMESQPQQVRLNNSRGNALPVPDEGSSLVPVDGRYSLAIEVSLPALPRSESHIGLLEGKLLAVAPSKMLRFSFDSDLLALKDATPDGAQRRLAQEDVVCRVNRVILARERWSVQVRLDYPEGNSKLESFQAGSLVANNELSLRSKDGKRGLSPTSYVIDQVSSRRALVTYHFTDRPGSPRGKAADWKLNYRAPARIVDLPFRFSFRNVPLP
jgi:hypothetical protein